MKILIFGTVYCDTLMKQRLASQWDALHASINPKCDLLLVDSASPFVPLGVHAKVQLGNNIGHLSRSGQDGWGRAFCAGLQYAIDKSYDYVVHVEGDSLCKIDVARACEGMLRDSLPVITVPVRGTKHQEHDWVETGLMFFDVQWLRQSNFIDMYDWEDGAGKTYPNTPEAVIWQILDGDLRYANWRTIRDDKGILSPGTSVHLYDWVTHVSPEVFDDFFVHNMPKVAA